LDRGFARFSSASGSALECRRGEIEQNAAEALVGALFGAARRTFPPRIHEAMTMI
jgi:hypothetical protein